MGLKEEPWAHANTTRVKLLGPAAVGYGHPDLEKTHAFLTDFGMVENLRGKDKDGAEMIYYRGYGIQPVIYIAKKTEKPEFVGPFFEAATENDLQNATQVPGASQIEDWVFGGKIVRIKDPAGNNFHVVYGYTKRPFTPRVGQVMQQNYPTARDDDMISKPRRGEIVRMFSLSLQTYLANGK